MEEIIFNGKWSSVTYPDVFGTCHVNIKNIDMRAADDIYEIKMDYIITYDKMSKFKPDRTYIFTMYATYNKQSMRIYAQTALTHHMQYMLTISLNKTSVTAFYASVHPIDCGTVTIAEPRAKILEFLSK